jgi:DNA-binding LacI/PurR family transcriptional regulator
VEGVLALAPIDPSIRTDRPGDPEVVVSADFDGAMRGIGEIADAAPLVEMMERLAELGRRRFFHVAGNREFASARARKAAYRDTVSASDWAPPPRTARA